jgi:hypothetical protein
LDNRKSPKHLFGLYFLVNSGLLKLLSMLKRMSVLCCLVLSLNAFGQGCSDAGFCTMGAMKPDQPYNKKVPIKLRSMEVSFYRGTTTLTPIIYVANIDASFSVGKKNSLQVKLPYQAVQGRLGNTSGLGDISLCLTRNIFTSDRFDVNASLGGKFRTNNSDKKSDEGYPLPMYYQTSLGTYDAIGGLSLISKKWLFATGIQVPFGENKNQFLWGRWPVHGEDSAYVHKYAKANQLKRGIDVMLRIERNFRFSRLNFSIGILPIYRITNDQILDLKVDPKKHTKPEGAKGLATSIISTVGYNFNVKTGIKLLVGHKIIQRDINPDGLSRELVTTFSYFYRF